MSVIIRLQNLPWSANALDIRQFFHGLSIPEGGVHIVGGEQGDAFIAFSTDEDARQAFARNNGKIKEVQISLMLSSRTEMQKVIEAARAQSYAAFMQNAAPTSTNQAQQQQQTTVPLPAAVPPLMPAAVPDFNKKETNKNDKRDRRRSRSKSRERNKDRDRRDRRYRDRSRSRSRERRDRRRRDRSRSRGRSRSRDRDRRNKRSPDNKKPTEIWSNQNSNDGSNNLLMAQQPPSLLANFAGSLDDARRNLNALNMPLNRNTFQAGGGAFVANRGWPVMGTENGQNFLLNRPDSNNSLLNARQGGNQNQSYQQNRRYPSRNFQKNDEQYSPNSERSDRESLPNTCVKLQPFFGGYGEIRRFFQGIFISNVGIKFINDEYGHRTGIVYVQFGHPQGKAEALQKTGEFLNGLQVEINHLDDQEFDEAIDRYQPDQNADNGKKYRDNKSIGKYFNQTDEPKVFSCLIVDDLPTYVKEQDILKMFSPRPLISLILTTKPRGGRIAYVKFGSTDEAKKALEENSNHIVEGKPVTVLACHDSEFEAINEQHDVDLERKPTNLDTDCLNLTRLPLQTNNIEITDFFSDIGVRPTKIHLMSNRLGFTGQAFCEFKTFEETNRALKKDNASFGPNIVSVQPILRDEMEHILQQSQMTNPQQQQQQQGRPMSLMAQPARPPFYPRNTYDNRSMDMGGGGGSGNGNGNGGMNTMPRFMNHRPPPRGRFNMNMNMNNHDQDPPGCTVYMDNVPYKAGTNEILEFFDGYDITNNVSRRYNPNNTPSAEAKVVFTSPAEAYRAVQERHGKKIWDRPIYLKQV